MPSSTQLTNGLERVRYFSRQLITADDMRAEQEYIREKLRRHNRMLHGTGVVCGLEVAAAPATDVPLRVAVSMGYAISPQGDEICVTTIDYLDLATCGKDTGDRCLPATSSSVVVTTTPRPDVFVAIRYDECPTRPVRVMPAGCGCGDASCDYSRTRDAWQLGCWPVPADWKAPPPPDDTCPKVIAKLLTCAPGSTDVWVILARVSFDALDNTKIKTIDNSTRRWLMSTAAIQGIVCSAAPTPGTTTPGTSTPGVSVTVVPPAVTIKVAESRTLAATVTASSGVATTVTWSSSNSVIATVNSNGVITGVSRGTAVITARSTADPTKSASTSVTVA